MWVGISVSHLDTETGEMTNISTGNLGVLYLDYHYTAGYIYWSDKTAKTIIRYISVVSIISLQLSSSYRIRKY